MLSHPLIITYFISLALSAHSLIYSNHVLCVADLVSYSTVYTMQHVQVYDDTIYFKFADGPGSGVLFPFSVC
jgi:hypothetical protein